MAEMERYFQDLVAANPAKGLAGRVTRHVRAGRLRADDAAAMLQLVFFAGHGPTAYMIGSGTALLLRPPTRLAQADSDRAVEELLRYVSVSHSGRQRVAVAEVVIGGRRIAAGEGVLIQLDAANRDPVVFADPDDVDLAAPARPHLAFAHGVHICTGRALARIELRTVFGRLAQRAPTLRLAVAFERLRFTEHENILGVEQLPVTW
jgi:cytochrome P450